MEGWKGGLDTHLITIYGRDITLDSTPREGRVDQTPIMEGGREGGREPLDGVFCSSGCGSGVAVAVGVVCSPRFIPE